MKYVLISIACLLVWAFNCSGVRGQGCLSAMQSHYDTYTSITWDGTRLYTSVTIQGNASIIPTPGCNFNGVTHRANALNLLAGIGGWVYGTPSCVSCFLSTTNNQSIAADMSGSYPFTWVGSVVCSYAGQFFSKQGNVSISCQPAVTAYPYSVTCNGTTVRSAEAIVGGQDYPHVHHILYSASTDANLVIELVGAPYPDTLCPPSTEACLKQDYKTHTVPGEPSGNIIWTIQVFCYSTSLQPDRVYSVTNKITCQ